MNYGYHLKISRNGITAIINGYCLSIYKSVDTGKWKSSRAPNAWRRKREPVPTSSFGVQTEEELLVRRYVDLAMQGDTESVIKSYERYAQLGGQYADVLLESAKAARKEMSR